MDLPTNANNPETRMTSDVFWRRVPLQDTAAGTTSTRSRTPSSRRGGRSRRANSQPNSCEGTIDSYTHNFTIFNECFSPIPGALLLLTVGRLPLCLNNWLQITSNQWVIQAVRGYKLELISASYQESPPRFLGARGHLSTDQEIRKLMSKGAVRKVTSCANQFLSQIFLVSHSLIQIHF